MMYLCGRVRQGNKRERERERERGGYHVVDEDELIEVVLVGKGEMDVFTGYALKEIEGVAQEKMLGEVRSSLLGE